MKWFFAPYKCPKCNKQPVIKYGATIDDAQIIGLFGLSTFYFYVKCCGFIEYASEKSYALEKWNTAIKNYNQVRKNMKFEILNENIDQSKEKVLFKLEDEDQSIRLLFKKNSEDRWVELVKITQDGAIKIDNKYFNKYFINES